MNYSIRKSQISTHRPSRLDTRMVNGQKSLLFGPFAGFSPKFLKSGSVFDLLSTTTFGNVFSMISVALGNLNLLKYLYKEVFNTHKGRVRILQEFYPEASASDWKLITAGVRVQIIKKMKNGKSILQFGTEVVSAEDGSLAALLGASPGASTCVKISLEVLEKCFPSEMSSEWTHGIEKMVPSYKKSLKDDAVTFKKIHSEVLKTLKIEP